MTQFTIVLPTTADRASTLETVLRHVRLQSITDWELFIIGDGVNEETRQAIERWCADDPRMRFFDHPKHARRGEEYRHAALSEARGRNVAYLCDRDLWLFDHLETLARVLDGVDFAHTQCLVTAVDGALNYQTGIALEKPWQRRGFRHRGLPLAMSSIGHSLASYRRLPHGWRTTPAGIKTDRYMWQQFLDQPWCRARSVSWPTLLYFNRGDHPGWPSEARAKELVRWNSRLADVDSQHLFRAASMRALGSPGLRAQHVWRSWLFWHPRAQHAYQRLRAIASG